MLGWGRCSSFLCFSPFWVYFLTSKDKISSRLQHELRAPGWPLRHQRSPRASPQELGPSRCPLRDVPGLQDGDREHCGPPSPCLDFILGGSCRTVSIWEESCPRAVGVRRGVSFQGGNRRSPRRCREPPSTAAPRSHPSGRGEGRGFGGKSREKRKKKKPQFANCQIGVINLNHLLRCSVQEAAGHSLRPSPTTSSLGPERFQEGDLNPESSFGKSRRGSTEVSWGPPGHATSWRPPAPRRKRPRGSARLGLLLVQEMGSIGSAPWSFLCPPCPSRPLPGAGAELEKVLLAPRAAARSSQNARVLCLGNLGVSKETWWALVQPPTCSTPGETTSLPSQMETRSFLQLPLRVPGVPVLPPTPHPRGRAPWGARPLLSPLG